MLIRAITIKNFRGIKLLEWKFDSRFCCLIGQGDSTKSTILDAISIALSPRWAISLTDVDFYECDITRKIEIEVTVTDIPPSLNREDVVGHMIRGVTPEGELVDEPSADDAPALTIRFTADDTLEPVWELVKDAAGEPVGFSAKRRAALGLYQVDDKSDFHLRWSQGSALTGLTVGSTTTSVLTAAQRAARSAIADNPNAELKTAAEQAAEVARKMGAADIKDPLPGLDPAGSGKVGTLVLHDGTVPATRLGLGSKRLASTAFQLEAMHEQSIVLIDEIEAGLEPHRLRHLLASLEKRAADGKGQVIFTTHSPIVVEIVNASQLSVVRNRENSISVYSVPPVLEDMKNAEPQATIRSGPSAMLARRIVVGEGATELGIGVGLAKHWDEAASVPLALVGSVFRDGKGSQAPVKAEALAKMGYEVGVIVDNDLGKQGKAAFDAALGRAKSAGAVVFECETDLAIEQQICKDLPFAELKAFLELADELKGGQGSETVVIDAVESRVSGINSLDPQDWLTQGHSEVEIRDAIGTAAKSGEWFKTESNGIRLGEFIAVRSAIIPATTRLATNLQGIKRFIYNEATQ